MQALQNIVESITSVFRMGLLLWFGLMLLFGFAMSALTYSGHLWGNSPEALEARALMEERRIAAQAEADRRKLDMQSERDMRKDGWGNSAPVATKTDRERRRDEAFKDLRETQARRDEGWGS